MLLSKSLVRSAARTTSLAAYKSLYETLILGTLLSDYFTRVARVLARSIFGPRSIFSFLVEGVIASDSTRLVIRILSPSLPLAFFLAGILGTRFELGLLLVSTIVLRARGRADRGAY